MGDKPEFDAFVMERWHALLRTAYLLTRDEGRAEDLVQTALTRLWFAWDRIEGDPEPYVRRIMVNTHTSWWRRRWWSERATDRVIELVERERPTEVTLDLWTALGRLPSRQRAVVVLRYFDDLTEAKTAEQLGCSVGTVKSQHAKAMRRLRQDVAVAPATEEATP